MELQNRIARLQLDPTRDMIDMSDRDLASHAEQCANMIADSGTCGR